MIQLIRGIFDRIMRRRRFAAMAVPLLVISGCFPPDEIKQDSPPDPVPIGSPVEQAAQAFIGSFAEAWAVEAETTAAKADSYKSWDEAFGDWAERNQAARVLQFEATAQAIDTATGKENAPYDKAAIEALRKSAREAATGYRKGR